MCISINYDTFMSVKSFPLLLLKLLSYLSIDGWPTYLSYFLCCLCQLLVVFLLANPLEVLLAEGDHHVQVNLEVSG